MKDEAEILLDKKTLKDAFFKITTPARGRGRMQAKRVVEIRSIADFAQVSPTGLMESRITILGWRITTVQEVVAWHFKYNSALAKPGRKPTAENLRSFLKWLFGEDVVFREDGRTSAWKSRSRAS